MRTVADRLEAVVDGLETPPVVPHRADSVAAAAVGTRVGTLVVTLAVLQFHQGRKKTRAMLRLYRQICVGQCRHAVCGNNAGMCCGDRRTF